MSVPLLLLSLGLAQSLSLTLPPPDELLWDGVRHFTRGDWAGARDGLLGALRSLREVRGIRLRCREECGLRGSRLEEAVMERADCLDGCERLRMGQPSLYRLTQETEKTFHRGAPYNYLQIAHYKLAELDEAAAAAFTFYMRNPHHEQIQEDVKRYRRMKGVQEQSFRDLEEPTYKALFAQGVSLLSEGRTSMAVSRLEESLASYLSMLQECRTLCEGTRENENQTHRDLTEVIAEYYTQVLLCKQHCVLEVTVLPGQKQPEHDVLVSHLQLLQDGYSQLGDWASAALTARSLLLFSPQNQTVLESLRGYDKRLGGKGGNKPRENVASYVRQTLSEKKLLYYAMEHLNVSFQDLDRWTPEDVIPEGLRERVRTERAFAEEAGQELPYEDVTVTLTPRQMNGTTRVTMDGVLTEDECESLLNLVQEAESSGDGFKGRRSPHTPGERIQGLSVMKALQMSGTGAVSTSRAHLYFHATERARVLVQTFFNTEALHFSFAQLECRTAIDGEQEGRSDTSDPVHADNCILDPEEKQCWKEPPAYMHRDYSGFLYLNDGFEGGETFFTELDGHTVTAEVRPSCGRLVLFSSGGENAHGVRAVTQGRRCAIAVWLTRAAEHAEQERAHAKFLVTGEQQVTAASEEEEEEPGKPSGRQQRRRATRKIRDEL